MAPRKNPVPRGWTWLAIFVALFVLLSQLPIGQQFNLGMSPILSAVQAPARWWSNFSLWFEENQILHAELQQNRESLARMAAREQELTTLREENIKLRKLLDIKQLQGYHWHAARVQGRSPDKMSQHLILLVDGASIDDVIVSSDGLVGLVDLAKDESAVVRTILDASMAVPVTTKTTPIAALARGQGDSLLIDFVSTDDAPPVGTILYSSGAGGLFPAGIPVAKITAVEPIAGEIFARIEATPVARWQRENWLAMASQAKKAGE